MKTYHLKTIKYTITLTVFFSSLVLFIAAAEARSVVRSGETVSLAEDQVINGDFYTAASKVNVSGEVQEDLVSVGGKITVNGSVGEDAYLVGGQVEVHGNVGDDLRIFSGAVTIGEPVAGDVFVLGGSVHILSTASIAGDLVLFTSEAVVEGSVGGSIIGTVDSMRIDALVAGDVDVTVGELTLGDRATIEGSVRYVSNLVAIQAQQANVAGDLVRSDPLLPIGGSSMQSALVPMLILFFSILVWYWLSRSSLRQVVNRALVMSPRPFLLGFIALFTPFLVAMLLVSMIGSLVALIGLFGYLLLIVLSITALPAVLGQLLMRVFNTPNAHLSLTSLAVGVIGVMMLLILPIVGHIILVGFIVVTFGALVDLIVRSESK